MVSDIRFLDSLRLDVPTREIILQDSNEALFWVIACFRARIVISDAAVECDGMGLPEDEVRVGHEICDALQHTARLKNECWEGDFG